MSRTPRIPMRTKVVRTCSTLAIAATAGLTSSPLSAQTALGTPFIGKTHLSFYSSELTRSGGPETTTMFGVVYGRRFGAIDRRTQLSKAVRGSARPFDDVNAGVLDVAATVAVNRRVEAIEGLSVAASAGAQMMGWGDDVAKTGRLDVTIPANAGVSYDLPIKRAVFSPYVMGTVGRYDLRTSLNDVRQTIDRGWDASYTAGASLRMKEVVLSSSRIVGEHAMPSRSRWTFSAGMSF